MKKKRIKICFAASSGGHYEQLLMLKPLMDEYDSFIITEKTRYATSVRNRKQYYLAQINRREKLFIIHFAYNVILSLKIFLHERPNIIICTGVLATVPICLISKIFKSKLIYIESFAKTTSPTETGKFLYKFADRFYVQWESMKEIYPDAIYIGGIY